MTKLFFFGLGIFALIVCGVFSAVMTPLMVGVTHNLGGQPQSPIHAGVPGQVSGTAHNLAQQATPQVILTGLLAILALLLIYTLGNLISHLGLQHKQTKQRRAELRWRARVIASREYGEPQEGPTNVTAAASQAEIDALWE